MWVSASLIQPLPRCVRPCANGTPHAARRTSTPAAPPRAAHDGADRKLFEVAHQREDVLLGELPQLVAIQVLAPAAADPVALEDLDEELGGQVLTLDDQRRRRRRGATPRPRSPCSGSTGRGSRRGARARPRWSTSSRRAWSPARVRLRRALSCVPPQSTWRREGDRIGEVWTAKSIVPNVRSMRKADQQRFVSRSPRTARQSPVGRERRAGRGAARRSRRGRARARCRCTSRDSSDAKNTAAGATRSGPRSGSGGKRRPLLGADDRAGASRGCRPRDTRCWPARRTVPFSIAVTLVSPRNANFDAVYALVSAVPCTESIEPMFTIAPRDARSIGRHRCVARNAPKQLTCMMRSNASGVGPVDRRQVQHGRVVHQHVEATVARRRSRPGARPTRRRR